MLRSLLVAAGFLAPGVLIGAAGFLLWGVTGTLAAALPYAAVGLLAIGNWIEARRVDRAMRAHFQRLQS